VRTTKAVIPIMRKQGSGTIINMSSLGGRVGFTPFGTIYHASKFALEGLTESLRHELAEFNIDVILIEPGNIRSKFMDNVKRAKNYDSNKSPYAQTVNKLFEGLQTLLADSSDTKDVAKVILDASKSSTPNVRYAVGAESVLKAKRELSDKELERWIQEGYMDRK
jgi:short-subunit dehydrogenase